EGALATRAPLSGRWRTFIDAGVVPRRNRAPVARYGGLHRDVLSLLDDGACRAELTHPGASGGMQCAGPRGVHFSPKETTYDQSHRPSDYQNCRRAEGSEDALSRAEWRVHDARAATRRGQAPARARRADQRPGQAAPALAEAAGRDPVA